VSGEGAVRRERNIQRSVKSVLSNVLALFLRGSAPLLEAFQGLYCHAALSASIDSALPASTVVLGRIAVYGSRRIHFGENVLLYPDVHLETQGDAQILIGDDVVISRGAHIVAMAGVTIGRGSLIGEYAGIRDANHVRETGRTIRESGHVAKAIKIGQEVWLGRGVTVLPGVTLGDRVTVGANAVVTKDVPGGATAVGVPAKPIAPTGTSNVTDKRAK